MSAVSAQLAVESVLRAHPRVNSARVLNRGDDSELRMPIAYATLRLDHESATSSSNGVSERLIANWDSYWSNVYGANQQHGPNFSGWDIPPVQMADWVEGSCQRIISLHPKRTLEIGCGVGLLIERIAPLCEYYRGIDISEVAIQKLKEWLRFRPDLTHVEVSRSAASGLEAIDVGSYDTIVLNSVIQYFPDTDYLLSILRRLVTQMADSATLFVGDITNFQLLRPLYCGVLPYMAPAEATVGWLRQKIENLLAYGNELYLAPDLLLDITRKIPEARTVQLTLKRGRSESPMTRYRYDAIITKRSPEGTPSEMHQYDWRQRELSIQDLGELVRNGCSSLSITHIPNKRLARDLAAVDLISSSPWHRTMAEIRAALDEVPWAGLDPEDCWQLGADTGHKVEISWAIGTNRGEFDVRIIPSQHSARAACHVLTNEGSCDWSGLATNPSLARRKSEITMELWRRLRAVLPEEALPCRIAIVDELPTD